VPAFHQLTQEKSHGPVQFCRRKQHIRVQPTQRQKRIVETPPRCVLPHHRRHGRQPRGDERLERLVHWGDSDVVAGYSSPHGGK
jgi:hypothetical protein